MLTYGVVVANGNESGNY